MSFLPLLPLLAGVRKYESTHIVVPGHLLGAQHLLPRLKYIHSIKVEYTELKLTSIVV